MYSKVNQVIYSSIPIYLPGFKALTLFVFEILFWKDFIHIFSKGNNSGNGLYPDGKIRISYFFTWGIHIWHFKTLACTVQKLCYASKSMQCKICPKLQRAITHEVFFRIYSKVNQVIYSPIPIHSPGFKALASMVFEIFCWQDFVHICFKVPLLRKGAKSCWEKNISTIFS